MTDRAGSLQENDEDRGGGDDDDDDGGPGGMLYEVAVGVDISPLLASSGSSRPRRK